MTRTAKRILVVYDHRGDPSDMRLSIKHHLLALDHSDAGHKIVYYNTYDDAPNMLSHDRPMPLPDWVRDARFDAVVLHNTFLCFRWTDWYFYRWKNFFKWIGELDCPKVAICQDEFDHAGILDEWLFEWHVTAIASLYDDASRGPLYPILSRKAAFRGCFAGYIDEQSARRYADRLPPFEQRKIDISYRARDLPFWFGSAGQLKSHIAEVVSSRASQLGFRCDISTRSEDAIVGECWLDFLAASKATIGCEGGSSVIDWRGETRAQINRLLDESPGISFDEVDARMPEGWNDYRFLSITPRHFEAIITKTCQILIEGDFNGVLLPDQHYIPLKPDFSNLDEALLKLRDPRLVQEIVDRAYEEVYLSGQHTYHTFANEMDELLAA